MNIISLVLFLAMLATVTVCRRLSKREIGRDTHAYAIGPTVQPHQAHLYGYQVAFQEDCGQNCGGTIISDRHIITAAHCVSGSDPRPMTIKAGVTFVEDPVNGQIRSVFSVKTHHNFKISLENDVALLTLQEPLNLTGLTVAKLPEADEDFEGEVIEASGWGHTVNLTYAYFTVRHNSECQHPSRLCADNFPNMKIYVGDSGGPAVLRRDNGDIVLVGIVSGITYAGQHKFTNVAYLRNWIDEAMLEAKKLGAVITKLGPKLPGNKCPKVLPYADLMK